MEKRRESERKPTDKPLEELKVEEKFPNPAD